MLFLNVLQDSGIILINDGKKQLFSTPRQAYEVVQMMEQVCHVAFWCHRDQADIMLFELATLNTYISLKLNRLAFELINTSALALSIEEEEKTI